MIRRRRRALAIVSVLVVLLAGCSDDDGGGAAGDTSTTADAEADGDGGGQGEDGGGASEEEVGTGPAVASAGCDTAPHPPSEAERVDTTSGGVERYYLITAPEDEEPMPLVVDLHGYTEGADVHFQHSALGEYGIDQGFVTVFPNGSGSPVAWDVGGGESPDLTFIDTVIDEVAASHCIDTSRVYATGLSMGAFMTSLLACERADRFAAFAPVNGLQLPEGCQPSRPVPLLTFHGTADPILLFNGGIDTSSFTGGEQGASATIPPTDLDGEGYPATAAAWAELQGCTDPTDVVAEPVIDRTWTCPDGAAMEFVIIEGQGHGWPGSAFAEQIASIVGPSAAGVDANEIMWEFFQRYQLPV